MAYANSVTKNMRAARYTGVLVRNIGPRNMGISSLGYSERRAPIIPDIAPDAPRAGMSAGDRIA